MIVVAKKLSVLQLFISRMPKMCAILQLVSAPLNPIPIAEHFRRSHPLFSRFWDRRWKALLEQWNLDFFKVCRYHLSTFITQWNLLISLENHFFIKAYMYIRVDICLPIIILESSIFDLIISFNKLIKKGKISAIWKALQQWKCKTCNNIHLQSSKNDWSPLGSVIFWAL